MNVLKLAYDLLRDTVRAKKHKNIERIHIGQL